MSDNKKTKIREIVYCQDDDKSFGDIFIYEPENIEEQKLGNLFIIGELKDLPRNCSYVVNLLVSKIKKEFYSNHKRTSEEALEASLSEANSVIRDITQQGNGNYIGRLNMVCGTYKDRKFHISQIGKIKSLLIRNKKISEIIKESDIQSFSSEKAFNNIASGELIENDLIIFGTPGLLNIFSKEKIKALADLDVDEFTSRLQEEIEEKEEELVSALIIKMEEKNQDYEENSEIETEEAESPQEDPEEPEQDQEDWNESEKNVEVEKVEEENTKEKIKNNVRKISLNDIIKEYEKIEGKSSTSEKSENNHRSMEVMMSRKEENGFDDLDEKNPNILQRIIEKLKSFTERDAQEETEVLLEKENSQYGDKIKNILAQKKLIALFVIIFVLIVAKNGLQATREQEKNTIPAVDYEKILSQSESKMEQAEIELISNSNKNAGILFVEARDLAQRVIDESDEFDGEAERIKSKAQTEIDRIDLLRRIDAPEILAYAQNDNLKRIIETNGTTYIIDTLDKTIYKINQETKQLEELSKLSADLGNITTASVLQEQEIIFADGSKIASFNSSNNQSNILTSASKSFSDLATYGGKYIYVLSPENNQIYKAQKTERGLSEQAEWIKSGDIRDAVSMTIDQYIYILTSDGEVKKYFIGSEYQDVDNKTFSIEQPLETVTNPNKIITIPEKKYLYILESSKNRILVFDKQTGTFIKQFTGQAFEDIQDISIDPEENFITVATKKEIFKIDINY